MASPRRRHWRSICQPLSRSDDVFYAGSDAALSAVVVVVDDAAGLVAPQRGDRRDTAVAVA